MGLVGVIRFPQLFDKGSGDYPEARHKWPEQMGLDTIVARIHQRRKQVAEAVPDAEPMAGANDE